MARNFLDLPAEMRSLIYEYVLTEEHELCYETLGGVGRLRPRNRGEFEGLEWRDEESEVVDDDSDQETEEATAPQLFPINQLQLVCKHLHQETKGLEMRYNTIFFTNSEDTGTRAPQQCAAFLRRLPEKQAKHMIVKVISDLVLFCKNYPDSRIDIHLETIYCSPWQYRTGAMFVDITFGKERALGICDLKPNGLVVLPSQANAARDTLIGWSFTGTPANFRLFPSFEAFDEESFRDSSEFFGGEELSVSVGEYTEWAGKWHRDGA